MSQSSFTRFFYRKGVPFWRDVVVLQWIAQILSAAMMLRYSFGLTEAADAVEKAVEKALNDGIRTGDIYQGLEGEKKVNTVEMGEAIVSRI